MQPHTRDVARVIISGGLLHEGSPHCKKHTHLLDISVFNPQIRLPNHIFEESGPPQAPIASHCHTSFLPFYAVVDLGFLSKALDELFVSVNSALLHVAVPLFDTISLKFYLHFAGDVKLLFEGSNSMLQNVRYHTVPAIIHGNGGSKVRHLGI